MNRSRPTWTPQARAGSPLGTTIAGLIGLWIADFPPARNRFARLVAQRRAEGSLPELALALFLLAAGEQCTGRVQAGFDASAEGLELVRQLGSANDEAQLFLSSRTVEYHLGKVFTKLGVASRVELARLPLESALTGQSA